MKQKQGIYERYMKRLLDFALSFVPRCAFPVLLITAFLVKTNLEIQSCFQGSSGKDEKSSRMYKFRSMTDQRDKMNSTGF